MGNDEEVVVSIMDMLRAKPHRVRAMFMLPMGMQFVIDNKTIWKVSAQNVGAMRISAQLVGITTSFEKELNADLPALLPQHENVALEIQKGSIDGSAIIGKRKDDGHNT